MGLYMLSLVDSMMIVDKSLLVIYANRLNKRLGDRFDRVYSSYVGYKYLEVYPNLKPDDSTMIRCLKTGRFIISETQTHIDVYGNVYNTKSITIPIIRFGEIIAALELSHVVTSVGDSKMIEKNIVAHEHLSKIGIHTAALSSIDQIITVNSEMIDNINKLKIFAMNDDPVLIYGETGTGKELFAEAIVQENTQRSKKFITQNCAAIPENLFESLLFGSTKGAFTGAENKVGLFELANNGFLFLDELNSMPLHMQAKLLRVLQDGKIRPVGSSVEKSIDVKVIIAVNKNPLQLIQENLLREDLFYRLSGRIIFLSPIRERKEDIPVYIDYFLKQFNSKYGKNIRGLSSSLEQTLLKYWWPGNVRELRHVIESMVSLSNVNELSNKNLPIYLKESLASIIEQCKEETHNDITEISRIPLKYLLENTEKEHITKILKHCNGNITCAAEILDMPRQTLKFRMDKLGIKRE
jgi:arginine utilization regulatory protein